MAFHTCRPGGFASGSRPGRRHRCGTTSPLRDAFDRLEQSMHRSPFHRTGHSRSIGGLKTDKANGKLMGVCAGLARRLGITPTTARVLFIIAAIPMGMLWFLVPLYVILGFVLDDYGDSAETVTATAQPQQAARDIPPDLRFADLRRKFDDLERRTGSMEREVSSPDFDLKRAFRDLGAKDSPRG